MSATGLMCSFTEAVENQTHTIIKLKINFGLAKFLNVMLEHSLNGPISSPAIPTHHLKKPGGLFIEDFYTGHCFWLFSVDHIIFIK
jgi:hypothetical protein